MPIIAISASEARAVAAGFGKAGASSFLPCHHLHHSKQALPDSTTSPLVQTPAPANENVYNWARTRVLAKQSNQRSPKSLQELREIVSNGQKVRPIGSKLTYEALTSSAPGDESILLDMSHFHGLISFEDDRATFWAGTTIAEISECLRLRNKYLNTSPGVIGIQTIAGCLGTGTHGQGLHVVPMSDTLLAADLMLANGEIISVSQDTPDMLNALRTNLGLFGLVLSCTISIQDLRILTCNKATINVNEFKRSFIDLQRNEEYCKGWWFPDSGWVHVWAASEASKEHLALYRDNNSQLTAVETNTKLDKLATSIAEIEARMIKDTASHDGKQFETISRFKNAVPVTGTMQQVYMKGIPVPQINCEIAVPLSCFEESVEILTKWYQTTTHKLHYPFIFRCTNASEALLAPHRGQQLCWIGFLVYLQADGKAAKGSFEMMREIQQLLVPLGGTPHWGKHFVMELYDFPGLYPEYDKFVALMRSKDPTGKFQNEWTRNLFSE